MVYIKTTWENEPSESTPINATNLNKIENGIYNNSLITDTVGDVNNLNTTDKSSVVNAINEVNGKFGKLLWTGSFTSGSITVDGLSDYSVIIVKLDVGSGVYCIGGKEYGAGGIGGYNSYTIGTYAYRLANSSANELSITATDKGGISGSGSSQVPISAIYGLF